MEGVAGRDCVFLDMIGSVFLSSGEMEAADVFGLASMSAEIREREDQREGYKRQRTLRMTDVLSIL